MASPDAMLQDVAVILHADAQHWFGEQVWFRDPFSEPGDLSDECVSYDAPADLLSSACDVAIDDDDEAGAVTLEPEVEEAEEDERVEA